MHNGTLPLTVEVVKFVNTRALTAGIIRKVLRTLMINDFPYHHYVSTLTKLDVFYFVNMNCPTLKLYSFYYNLTIYTTIIDDGGIIPAAMD